MTAAGGRERGCRAEAAGPLDPETLRPGPLDPETVASSTVYN